MRWYFETRHPLGRWSPNASLTPPRIEKHAGVERVGSGTGPRIRGLTKIPETLAHLPLDQLQAVLGPDSKQQETTE